MDRFEERSIVDNGQVQESGRPGRFDASQYAFFGRDVTQEVELGGLDDDEDDGIGHLNDIEDEDIFSTSTGREELGGFDGSSEVGDLTNSFSKLNAADQSEREFLGRDVPDLPADISWTDTNETERKQWSSPPRQTLQRQQQDVESIRSSQQWWNNNQSPLYNVPKPMGAPMMNKQQQFVNNSPMGHGQMLHYGIPQLGSPVQSSPWSNPVPPPQAAPPRHPLMPPQVMLQYQRPQNFSGIIHPQQKPENMTEFRGRQTPPRGSPSPDTGSPYRKTPEMRSKYMSSEEIETIARIQWAATHGSDPYTEDYYHQAMQAKLAGGTPHGRRHFAPSHLRELPSHARTAAEPHAFLQVDALGRIPFSSIRRPRPLVDVDGVNGSIDKSSPEAVPSVNRRLEQEPMLAARIAVEDGLCLLLDVDDIDRMLACSQPDGGAQLRRRRQMLMEGLAASLQLVDPLAPGRDSRFGLAAKDDLVFLRLVSLPKGRKLLSRYLKLLVPGSELVRIVLMAVFRHLRFLFGGLQSDPSAAASSMGLANAVATTIKSMDLASLSACLAAVVLASEPPPLRPIGSPSGDGATVVLQAVLDRATAILTDRSVQFPAVQNTTVWQASFDAFFGLLSKYCANKYESIIHSLMMASSSANPAAVNAVAASAMAKEMPIELLRASLPHTNEHQRKRLLEFAQRSLSMGPGGVTGEGIINTTAAVKG